VAFRKNPPNLIDGQGKHKLKQKILLRFENNMLFGLNRKYFVTWRKNHKLF